MFVAILPLCFCLILLILSRRDNPFSLSYRSAFLLTCVIFGALVVLSSEVLSLFRILKFSSLLFFWILMLLISSAYLCILWKKKLPAFKIDIPRLFPTEIIYLFFTSLICFLVGLIAISSAPNTWDAMTYHMSRVVHWIQNQTLAPYPTNIYRQVTYPPFAEFAIMQFQIFGQTDRWANMVQWFSFLGSIIGVSLIAKKIGANRQGQIVSSLLAATIPMGILQGSSTQNDFVIAFWLVCFIVFLLELKFDLNGIKTMGAGMSLGLMILTKGTGYIYAIPFLIWFMISGAKKHRLKIGKPLLIIVLVALLINAGYFVRNFQLHKSLFPSSESSKLVNEHFSLGMLTSNVARNAGLHFETFSPQINRTIERSMAGLHSMLGIDPVDPRTTFGSYEFLFMGLPFHEDYAGNGVHLLTMLVASFLFIFFKNQRKNRNVVGYSIAAASTFLLFCFILKWQPWNSRLQLPIFVIYTPFIASVLAKMPHRKTMIFICLCFIIFSLPWLFKNQSRPLWGSPSIFSISRTSQYFFNRPNLRDPYIATTNYLKEKNCTDVGILIGEDSWEYPFWVLLNQDTPHAARLKHIAVANNSSNASSQKPIEDFTPCAIIGIDPYSKNKTEIVEDKYRYIKTQKFAFLDIFQKDADGNLAKQNLIDHFNETLKNIILSTQVIRQDTTENLFLKQDRRLAVHLKREYTQAKLINIEELNKAYRGLGDHFQRNLLKGLELRLIGFATSNKMRYRAGQKLTLQWLAWFEENKQAISDALAGY